MNLFKKIETDVRTVVEQLKTEGALSADVSAEKIEATPPRETSHGDVATNAALVIAPQAGKNPKEIATLLAGRIQKLPGIAKVDIAGPGFINMTLDSAVWQGAVLDILEEGLGYGNSTLGKGKKVNIEYVSVNPTGPMHVGHARYIYGDALATLMLKAGYNVTKEYYINDAGGQVDKVADSAFLRYREACGENIGEIPEGLYPGEYLIPVGQALFHIHDRKLLDKPREEWLPIVRDYALDAMMQLIKTDLGLVGIHHDVFTSERAITKAGKVEQAIAALDEKGLIYTGVLEPPKGKPTPEDWEAKPQTLFRSTQFGDDLDRPIKKSDGSWTYFAPDIAYHYDKITRGFDLLIDLFGADHGGYVKRIKSAVTALSDGRVTLEVKLCQLVKFMRKGEPLKMSKRAGTFITVREVVEEVGKDVFRFIMLTRKNDAPLDFDFEKVVEQSKDNPVFYVQYAHARAKSVIRRALEESPEALKLAEKPSEKLLARLTHPEELALIRLMCGWPRLVEQAAVSLEPHRVAFYLQDLAASFHGLWNLGNEDPKLRFIQKDDVELSAARIILTRALATVIASGLMVLGVQPVEEMR